MQGQRLNKEVFMNIEFKKICSKNILGQNIGFKLSEYSFSYVSRMKPFCSWIWNLSLVWKRILKINFKAFHRFGYPGVPTRRSWWSPRRPRPKFRQISGPGSDRRMSRSRTWGHTSARQTGTMRCRSDRCSWTFPGESTLFRPCNSRWCSNGRFRQSHRLHCKKISVIR